MVILKLSSVWWKVLLTTGHATFDLQRVNHVNHIWLHYRWHELHNLKFIFSLTLKSWHIYSLPTFSGHLFKRKEKKESKVSSTSTCTFNVHSTFICFCTLLLIVEHHWAELEVPLDISFACYCSLKFELIIDYMYYYLLFSLKQ
jgi:hypothetical protein